MAAFSGKKRTTKRSSSPAPAAVSSKKKKVVSGIEELEYVASNSPSSFMNYSQHSQCVFKDANFEHSGVNSSKKRLWKNLKQIIALERTLPWKQDDPTYSSIEAPPSFKPAKKYSDLSGLPAKYKDPQTRMLYRTSEEFSTIRNLPMDIVGGYLTLRKAAPT